MKFLKLEILNLASLDRQEGETINFEEGVLGNSNIFSIVGPTGSGKSTILDAICLALYNRTPRYPREKGDRKQSIEIYGQADDEEVYRLPPTDSRNILTRGKKEGYSKLTFLANNGAIYRAEWSVRFKLKAFDTAQTSLYKLVKKNGRTEEEVAEWTDLPRIIGLDYGQFLRTVLIAQGSFASFITASENDRYALLEKLVGCEDLYKAIAERIKQSGSDADAKYKQLAANVSAKEEDIIPADALQDFENRIAELEDEEKKVKEELDKVKASLGWYVQEEQYVKNIEQFDKDYQDALKQLDTIQNAVARLQLHDTTLPAVECYKDIQKTKEAIGKQDGDLKELEQKIQGIAQSLADEKNILAMLNKALEDAGKQLEEQRPHINKARTIKGELESANKVLAEKEAAERTAKEALEKAKKEKADNEEAIRKAREDLDAAENAYNTLKSAVDEEVKKKTRAASDAVKAFNAEQEKASGLDAALLQEADRVATQKKSDIATAIGILRTINDLRKEIENNNALVRQKETRNTIIDEELRVLKEDSDKLKEEIEARRKAFTLMTSENWEMQRNNLVEGAPCPLCGSIHHPYMTKDVFAPVIDDLKTLLVEREGVLEEKTRSYNLLSQEKSGNDAFCGERKEQVETAMAKLKTQKESWGDMHVKYPDWPDEVKQLEKMQQSVGDDAATARKVLDDYNALAARIDTLRKEKEMAESALNRYKEQSGEDLKASDKTRTEAYTTLQTEQGKTETLAMQEVEKSKAFEAAKTAVIVAKEDIRKKVEAIKAEIGDRDADSFEQQLTMAQNKASGDVEEQKGKIVNLTKEQEGQTGKVQIITKNKEAAQIHLAEKEPELNDWIRDYNSATERHLTVEDIAAISQWTDDWDAIRKEQTERGTAVTAARTTLDNERQHHQAHQENRPELAKEQLEERKEELGNKSNTELVEAKARKQRHDMAVRALGGLLKEKQEAELLKNEWKEIMDAIGGDGKTLRKIAQCYTLRFLIEHANAEIRKFNSRYELQQVKNSLGIRVIDHDRADDVRDTTSLSGGETFIVSLGLALGLSSLSSRNISFGNLFIDEGFGTLDPDTLATVIDSLAMLQSSQGKKVGVISHTDTMSERITTQIRIIKNGNSGSSHIEIYPEEGE